MKKMTHYIIKQFDVITYSKVPNRRACLPIRDLRVSVNGQIFSPKFYHDDFVFFDANLHTIDTETAKCSGDQDFFRLRNAIL